MSLLDTASLLLTPNAYKEGKLYSVIPSDGSGDLSVTRATTATRVNSAGLVELVPYNLLTYSEQFNNAAWNWVANSTTTANATTAPNGTLTADLLTESATLGKHYKGTSFSLYIPNSVTTTSVYVKPNGRTKFSITFDNDSQLNAGFDLLNESTIYTQTNVISASVENVGNGWYRCLVTNTPTRANPYVTFNILDNSGNASYTGDGTSGVYLWGAQAVEGTEAKDYYPTETRLNIPRIDYSLGSCPSILVEPQRTNLITYSEDYSSTWGSNFTSITKNLLSPSGITNASTIVNNVGPNRSIFKAISVVSGNTYQFSFWIKKISGAFVNSSAIQFTSWGPAVSSQTYTNIGTILTNDWVRYTHTFTATSTATVYIQFISNEIHTFGLYGAQLEAGAYPTSYIPTTTASVTRNGDLIEKTGISSLINSEEGVLFWEALVFSESGNNMIQISDNSDNNLISLYYNNGFISSQGKSNGTTSFSFSYDVDVTSYHKVAVKWKQNDFSLWVDGVKVATDVSGNPPIINSLNRLDFKYYWGGNPFYGKIKQLELYKEALTDDELATLTTI